MLAAEKFADGFHVTDKKWANLTASSAATRRTQAAERTKLPSISLQGQQPVR